MAKLLIQQATSIKITYRLIVSSCCDIFFASFLVSWPANWSSVISTVAPSWAASLTSDSTQIKCQGKGGHTLDGQCIRDGPSGQLDQDFQDKAKDHTLPTSQLGSSRLQGAVDFHVEPFSLEDESQSHSVWMFHDIGRTVLSEGKHTSWTILHMQDAWAIWTQLKTSKTTFIYSSPKQSWIVKNDEGPQPCLIGFVWSK